MPFTDTTAVFVPEIWDPATQKFSTVAAHAVPRTYHSIALLMLDGRVFTGGGGMVRVPTFLSPHSILFRE